MNDIYFESINDLYKRLLPALRSKKKILFHNNIRNIDEKDIWNYLRLNNWNQKKGLALCDMVDDILNSDEVAIITYYRNKRNNIVSNNSSKNITIELPKLKI